MRRLTAEMHHRVKNNLEIVSPLISLKQRENGTDTVSPESATRALP
jgi:two-component sensor histidine kinase